jgi:predicted transcriptional regulator
LKRTVLTNREKIITTVNKHPGLRFHEIKKHSKLANGTVEHHLNSLSKNEVFKIKYDGRVPRYYAYDMNDRSQVILLRLRQHTSGKIINALLKHDCQSFAQIVKFSKRSAGTVSVYKNMLLKDNIIVGDTNECSSCQEKATKIKYRLVDPDKVRLLVEEYGKSSLKRCSDNLSDIFLSLK